VRLEDLPTSGLQDFLGFDLSLSTIGFPGIVTLVILSILRGWLVPRKTHEDMVADRDHYRTALEKSEEARVMLLQQLDQALALAKTVDHVLRALPTPEDRKAEPA
jgi:hypothetical protein